MKQRDRYRGIGAKGRKVGGEAVVTKVTAEGTIGGRNFV